MGIPFIQDCGRVPDQEENANKSLSMHVHGIARIISPKSEL